MDKINSKIKKVKENKYVEYIPSIEILDGECFFIQYQFGDIYLKDDEYWFLTFDNHLGNFVSLKLFKLTDIKYYYKKNKTIDEFSNAKFIGNFFELSEDERSDLMLNKIFVSKNLVLQMIAMEDFERELYEIIEGIESIRFYLKNRLELLSIENLEENVVLLYNSLPIHFSFNLNVSKEHPRKYSVPFDSYYVDEENSFFFYSKLNEKGYVEFYYDNEVMDYNRFAKVLIDMKMSLYISVKKNFNSGNIFNKYINPLEIAYDYDKLQRLFKLK